MSAQTVMNVSAIVGLVAVIIAGAAGVTMIIASGRARVAYRAELSRQNNLPPHFWDDIP